MKRINGYNDLDDYFKRKTKLKKINLYDLEEAGVIEQEMEGSSALFWFQYGNSKFLFKALNDDYNNFSELISEELAKYLGFQSAQYDLATFDRYTGVIVSDFRNPKYRYINLYQIIMDYIYAKELKSHQQISDLEHYIINKTKIDPIDIRTNLEDIWNAIELYLYKKTDFEKEEIPAIIGDIMQDITDYFCYQFISGNYDLHSGNITLAISENNKVFALAPLYDNEDMFKKSGHLDYKMELPRLLVDRDNLKQINNSIELLKEYLKISDTLFVERFINMLDTLDATTIYQIFETIEQKIETEIPENIKETFATSFNANLKNIYTALEELNLSNKR